MISTGSPIAIRLMLKLVSFLPADVEASVRRNICEYVDGTRAGRSILLRTDYVRGAPYRGRAADSCYALGAVTPHRLLGR